jgi:starch synthase
VPIYQRRLDGFAHVPAVFTIHNLAYQGLFSPDWLPRVDLGCDLFTVDGLEYWGQISYMKGAINFADCITTVSRKYAEEIQTPEFGFGFDGILRRRRDDLCGILNGIDTNAWDPGGDPALPAPYDVKHLAGKAEAKRELLSTYGLTSDTSGSRPLVGMISRLVDQKGFDLIAAAAEELMALDASFVMLGTGDATYQTMWRTLAEKHPDRVGARIGFDERLAHLIEGGSDMFLMPSRFEPCGLNQMYSLRYGTVPIVRATGGLDDTVQDFDERTKKGTGFKFREYTPAALLGALHRALKVFRQPNVWKTIQRAAMKQDYSWDASAREYVKVYDRAVERLRSR